MTVLFNLLRVRVLIVVAVVAVYFWRLRPNLLEFYWWMRP
jgi:hypothetical protein